MIDLRPAAQELARLVAAVRDDQLAGPTPCELSSVAALLDHVDGLAQGLAQTARKQREASAPSADAAHLDPAFRDVVPPRLADLADAWADPQAWEGMTVAGTVDLPGGVAGLVVADELVVHGWDLAVATGQELRVDDATVQGALAFAGGVAAESPQGVPGLFGPAVPVPDDAPALDRLLGLTGRDPGWKP